jgi:hypothetical protein
MYIFKCNNPGGKNVLPYGRRCARTKYALLAVIEDIEAIGAAILMGQRRAACFPWTSQCDCGMHAKSDDKNNGEGIFAKHMKSYVDFDTHLKSSNGQKQSTGFWNRLDNSTIDE